MITNVMTTGHVFDNTMTSVLAAGHHVLTVQCVDYPRVSLATPQTIEISMYPTLFCEFDDYFVYNYQILFFFQISRPIYIIQKYNIYIY